MHFITPIHFFRSIFFILLFSQGGESVCPIGSQSVYFNSSCQPTTPGPIDTVFYLSGSINEGVTAFSTIINVSNSLTYWTSDNPTVVPGIALVSRSGGKLISNDTLLQSMLPIGSNPFSISTWIKCDVINRLESPYGSLFFWGKGYASYALTSLNMYISSVDVSSSNLVIVTTLAGRGGPSGPTSVLTNGIGTSATFASPTGVAVDSSFNVFIGDSDHQCIRKITSKGVVTTFAGSGVQGFADGVSTLANFFSPIGVAVDTLGYVYVADTFNNRIRKINQNGDVSTLAGEVSGYVDGTGTSASFKEPWGITVDTVGNIYVADTGNSRIRKITSSGIVTTLAGTGQEAYADGVGTLASFYGPTSLSVDLSGENIYVADVNNFCIRKVSSSTGTVSTLAGRGPNLSIRDGTGSNAVFEAPYSVTVDGSGNIYVTDSDPSILRHTIRKITPSAVVTTIAGRAETGYKDGFGTSAVFTDPTGIAVDNYGNLYATDFGDNRVRKIIFHPRPFPVCDEITWRHIALTFSGSPTNSMKTFIDGASFTSSNVVFEINSNDSTLEIFSSGLPAMTAISDLRIFNRAVSSAEVTNLSYVPPIQCLAGFYFSSGSCLPCPSGTFSAFGATSCSCLLCGGAGSVLDKLSENVTSIDNAVEALTQVSAVVDQLASFSNSSGVGGSSSSNANATALKTEIISLIGTITGVFSNSASSYLSRSSSSSNSTLNLTSLLNDTTILIPAAVSELLATNLVSLTSNPAQLTQASASSALDALSDILTLNLPLNVLSGAVDAEGGVRNNSGVAPFPISTATSFLSAINNVLNKFQEDIVRVDESNSKNGSKAASNALNQIDGTLNRLSAAVLRSSNAGSPAVSIISAPSSATFNSSSTTISGFCGDALSLTAMRVAMPSNSSSNASFSTAALNLPLEKPLSPCLAQGATVAKQQAVTPAVSANGAFLRTAKTASGALTGSVDASFVQYGESPVPQSLGWSSMGGANNKVIDSSSSLDTRVVSFKLLSQSGQKLEISGASSPMTLSIPFINPLANSSSSSVVSSYSRLSFNITCPGKSGLLVDEISTNTVFFLQALKSSSTVIKTSSKLTIVSHNKATGQALISVPCGNPIGIRNITCRGSNTSYTLSYDCPSISLQPVCAFWNETLNAWSSSGCVVAKVDRDSISCSCNHTTNFAARFVALADQQEDLFSFDSLSALGDTEALFRMYPHVFIIIGVITGIVLVSGFITYELDVFASKRFYETLRNDPEVQFLERIETLKGNVFILDRVMDRKVYDMQDKILRARLQSQAKDIAEAEGLYYMGPREEIPSDIDVNKFDWAPKKQPTFFFDFFSSCFSSSVSDTKANKDLDAEKRLQAPVMKTNPLQRKNMSTPGDATTVAIRQPPPVSNQGCLYRLTHRYTKAIYSKIKGSFETSKISATSKLSVISKTAGVSKSVVEAVKPSSEFDHLESMGEIENENVDGILEELQNATSCRRFMKLRSFLIRTWVLFVLFNHPYLSIFSKYDPRNPRYMRMLKLLVVLIGNLWATTFLYSFVNLEESAAPPVDDSFNMQGDDMQGVDMPPSMEEGEETPKTIPEVILIALMSCLLQVPISLLTTFFIRNASVAEFDARYPYIASELRRRARVEAHLSQMSQSLLEAELKNVSRTSGKKGKENDTSQEKGSPKTLVATSSTGKTPPPSAHVINDDDDFDKEMFAKSSRHLKIPSPHHDTSDDFDKEMFAKSHRNLKLSPSQPSIPDSPKEPAIKVHAKDEIDKASEEDNEESKDEFAFGWIDAPSEIQHYCPLLLRCCGRHPEQRSAYIERMRKIDKEKRELFEKKKQEARERKHKKKLKLRLFKKKKKSTHDTHDQHDSTGHHSTTSSTATQDAAFTARNAVATTVGVGALSSIPLTTSEHEENDNDEDDDDDGDAEGDDLGDFQGSGDDTGDEILGWIIWILTPLYSLFCSTFRNIDRVKTVESMESIIRGSNRNLKPSKDDKNKTLQEIDEESETHESILRQVKSKYSVIKYLPCTVSMIIALSVCGIIMAFQIFYISLFGFRNEAEVTLSLTIAWVLSQAWNLFIIEPGMSFVELLFTFVIRPAWLPYILWIPHVGPVVGGKVASDLVCKDGRSVLSGRMQNLTLVKAAGAASQLSPDLSVAAYGFGAVISATLSNVEDKLLTISKKAKKSATSEELKAAAKLSQNQRSELIVHRYTLAQLHSVEEAQKTRKNLAERLAKISSTNPEAGFERLRRHTTHEHLRDQVEHIEREASTSSPPIRAAIVFKRAAFLPVGKEATGT